MYKNFVKRLLDVLLSLIAIILLALPMLVIALITKLDSPGPALFRQKRSGMRRKTFTILKFRSMPPTVSRDTPTYLLKGDIRLTPWQQFLRRTSLDELPQLFNILAGHMSLIGPRPALWNEENLLSERNKYGANDVKPGLSGWAQINGRDELNIPERARLDGDYAQSLNHGRFRGFAMDARCFFRTFRAVLRAEGVIDLGNPSPNTPPQGGKHE